MKKELFGLRNAVIYSDDRKLLNNFHLHIYEGKILGILSSNTTEENSLIQLFSGSCRIDGMVNCSHGYASKLPSGFRFSDLFFIIDGNNNLINSLSIAENICMFTDNRRMVKKNAYRSEALQLLALFGVNLDIDKKITDLSVWEQLTVTLLKAYRESRRIIVLNNASNFVTESEFQVIEFLIRKMAVDNYSFVIMDSNENRIFDLSDDVQIIKGGTSVACFEPDLYDRKALFQYLRSGDSNKHEVPEVQTQGSLVEEDDDFRPYLTFDHVTSDILSDITFDVPRSELLKVFCLDRRSLDGFRLLINGESRIASGRIVIDGVPFHRPSDASQTFRQRFSWCPEAPYRNSIIPSMSLRDNMMLPLAQKADFLWMKPGYSRNIDQYLQVQFGIENSSRKASLFPPNVLQEVAYARYLISTPNVLFVEMPFTETDLLMRETTLRMLKLLMQRGITVVLLTASYSSLELISGDEVYIKDGNMLTEDELYQVFYGPMR